mgnify:CR=1 FL=1
MLEAEATFVDWPPSALTDLDTPREVDSDPTISGTQPFSSPAGGPNPVFTSGAGHKWNFDAAGYGTHTGYNGSSVFDVRDPARPRLVTTTGAAGRGHARVSDEGPLAERIVTTSPDVTVSTNLGAWVNQRGLFRRQRQQGLAADSRPAGGCGAASRPRACRSSTAFSSPA